MGRPQNLLLLLALPILLAAEDAPAPLSDKARGELAGRTAGEPLSCVPIRALRSTRIVDESAIIYKTSNRLWYVNQPDRGHCALLRPNRVIVTRTQSSQLCANDLVMIAEQNAPVTYGACGLGSFVPYTR